MSTAEPAQAAEAVVAEISEPLTWAEICCEPSSVMDGERIAA